MQPLEPGRHGVRLHADRFGNFWSVLPLTLIGAAMANWCGWTFAETMRAPLGTVLAVFDMRIRDDDD